MTDPPFTVRTFTRTRQLRDPTTDVLGEISELSDAETVEEVTIVGWPDEIVLGQETVNDGVLTDFRRIQAWAERNRASVQPPFCVQEVASPLSEVRDCVLRTPVLCLLVERDDTIVDVYPHSKEDEHYSIRDGIDRIRSGTTDGKPVNGEPQVEPPRQCTVCSDDLRLLNGVGVCQTCRGAMVGVDV